MAAHQAIGPDFHTLLAAAPGGQIESKLIIVILKKNTCIRRSPRWVT